MALELLLSLLPLAEVVRDMLRVSEHSEDWETGAVVADLGLVPASEIRRKAVEKVPGLAGVGESISAASDNFVSEPDSAIGQASEPALGAAIRDPGTVKVEEEAVVGPDPLLGRLKNSPASADCLEAAAEDPYRTHPHAQSGTEYPAAIEKQEPAYSGTPVVAGEQEPATVTVQTEEFAKTAEVAWQVAQPWTSEEMTAERLA